MYSCMHEERSNITPYLLQKDVPDELSNRHVLALRTARLELLWRVQGGRAGLRVAKRGEGLLRSIGVKKKLRHPQRIVPVSPCPLKSVTGSLTGST